jgi:hypothetical protein
MIDLKQRELWLATGSQHLYGPETLERVADHARAIARALDDSPAVPVRVVWKPVLTTPDEIYRLATGGNAAPACVGSSRGCTPSRRPRCGSPGCARCRSRSCTCTRSSTATSRGATSTWTS